MPPSPHTLLMYRRYRRLAQAAVTVTLAAASFLLGSCTVPKATAPPSQAASTEAPTLDVQAAAVPTATTSGPGEPARPAITMANIGGLQHTTTIGYGEVLRSLAFDPAGTVLATAAGNAEDFAVRLWGLQTGAPVGALEGHTAIVWQITFSPDGELLVSVSKDKTARIWDWRNGAQLHMLTFPDEASSAAFSPDGLKLAVGAVNGFPDASVWIFPVAGWQLADELEEYWNIPEIAWSPDGDYIVAGGTSRSARIWRVYDGSVVATLSHSGQVTGVAISPDGATAVTSGCRASDESRHCTAGGVWIWNMPAGTQVRQLEGFADWVEDIAFTSDGTLLLAGSRDGFLRAYSTADWALVFEGWTFGGMNDLAIGPGDSMVATGRRDGKVDIWTVSP